MSSSLLSVRLVAALIKYFCPDRAAIYSKDRYVCMVWCTISLAYMYLQQAELLNCEMFLMKCD